MIARILVVIFALIVIGVGAAVGYFVLGDTSSILGTPIGQLADPLLNALRRNQDLHGRLAPGNSAPEK